MSEAQQLIQKHYENICRDLWTDPEDLGRNLEVYKSIRNLIYDCFYDYSTVLNSGLDDDEIAKLKKEYKPNKYEKAFQIMNQKIMR